MQDIVHRVTDPSDALQSGLRIYAVKRALRGFVFVPWAIVFTLVGLSQLSQSFASQFIKHGLEDHVLDKAAPWFYHMSFGPLYFPLLIATWLLCGRYYGRRVDLTWTSIAWNLLANIVIVRVFWISRFFLYTWIDHFSKIYFLSLENPVLALLYAAKIWLPVAAVMWWLYQYPKNLGAWVGDYDRTAKRQATYQRLSATEKYALTVKPLPATWDEVEPFQNYLVAMNDSDKRVLALRERTLKKLAG